MELKISTRVAAGIASTAAIVLLAAGCASDKHTQPYQDAPRTGNKNEVAADIVTNPDGFSNVATKCDHGNRLYVIYHGDAGYGSIAVVANDVTCK